jgi:hypothetical protein
MAPKKLVAAVESVFKEHSKPEEFLRTGTTFIILLYVLLQSSVFGNTYSASLQELYIHPWWRLLVVLLVGIGSWWCPRVGLALALAVFFYFTTMASLSNQ